MNEYEIPPHLLERAARATRRVHDGPPKPPVTGPGDFDAALFNVQTAHEAIELAQEALPHMMLNERDRLAKAVVLVSDVLGRMLIEEQRRSK